MDGEKDCPTSKPPHFPILPEANSPTTIHHALYTHCLPPKLDLPQRGRLSPHAAHDIVTKEEIALALAKSAPSSAGSHNKIPYSVWQAGNCNNPEIPGHCAVTWWLLATTLRLANTPTGSCVTG